MPADENIDERQNKPKQRHRLLVNPEEEIQEPTLATISHDAARLVAIAEEARTQEIQIERLIGNGSYSLVFMGRLSSERCVVKIPYIPPMFPRDHPDAVATGYGPNQMQSVSLTGPFVLRRPFRLEDAEHLLKYACEKQSSAGIARPLPELYATKVLGGVVTAFYEYIPHRNLAWRMTYWLQEARSLLPTIARELLRLHRTFGYHGDLKPEHILCGDNEVVFLDPISDPWMGSIGYTLPFSPGVAMKDAAADVQREVDFLRDLCALASIVVQMWGGDLGWNGRVLYCMINRWNGRFGRGFDLPRIRACTEKGAQGLPANLKKWVLEICNRGLDRFEGGPLPEPGFCSTMLEKIGRLI